jgi:glycosyltransferase involved in cell wall biosynthesis
MSQKPQVKICIVTPTYNAVQFLAECLRSVASQREPGVEVEHLVLDGGSTDGTLDVLDAFPVTRLPRAAGSSLLDAMCMGFESAQGHLVGFLGADDIFLPGALAAVANVYRGEHKPVILCRSQWGDHELRSLGELAPPPRWLSAPMHASLGWNYIGAASTFLTPELYKQLGGFDRTFHKAEDYELYTRILARGIAYSTLDRSVCIYRRHGKNDSLNHDERYHEDLERVRQLYCPQNSIKRWLLRNLFKLWVYGTNRSWAYHQLKRKLGSRRLRG